MSDRFELVEMPESFPTTPVNSGSGDRIVGALADNMGDVLGLAKGVLDIQKINAMSAAYSRKSEDERAAMREEAEAYVKRKAADTRHITDKAQRARELLQDYYKNGKASGIPPEVFADIVKNALN